MDFDLKTNFRICGIEGIGFFFQSALIPTVPLSAPETQRARSYGCRKIRKKAICIFLFALPKSKCISAKGNAKRTFWKIARNSNFERSWASAKGLVGLARVCCVSSCPWLRAASSGARVGISNNERLHHHDNGKNIPKLDLASNHSFEAARRAESEFGILSLWRALDPELTKSGIVWDPVCLLLLRDSQVSSELGARARLAFAPWAAVGTSKRRSPS